MNLSNSPKLRGALAQGYARIAVGMPAVVNAKFR
jgi:hypothetical protein